LQLIDREPFPLQLRCAALRVAIDNETPKTVAALVHSFSSMPDAAQNQPTIGTSKSKKAPPSGAHNLPAGRESSATYGNRSNVGMDYISFTL